MLASDSFINVSKRNAKHVKFSFLNLYVVRYWQYVIIIGDMNFVFLRHDLLDSQTKRLKPTFIVLFLIYYLLP